MKTFAYDGVHALVLGLGVSGEAATRLLLMRGSRVVAVDQGKDQRQIEVAAALREAGAEVSIGIEVLPADAFDLCVVSPVFDINHPWLAICKQRGIPVISELELGSHYTQGKILAVTGSKGKSSLVKWCADTLNSAGLSAAPAGNYGTPLSQLVVENPNLQWNVTEVSSFQMEHTEHFTPDIAILLNIQEDHLDRHSDMNEYVSLKLKMFNNMLAGSVAILPAGLEVQACIPQDVVFWRFGAGAGSDWVFADHEVSGLIQGRRSHVSISGTWFDNPIFGLAAAAGVAALRAAGLSESQIANGLQAFEPLPHRMQEVCTDSRGVRYVNDSKATSLAATGAALRMMGKSVRLIAGGLLKEHHPEILKELLTETTKKVYLIGRCSEVLSEAWSSTVPCEECGTLEQAVEVVAQEAESGDVVLLSPGTASFDQFKSYRERGERFMAKVRAVTDL